MACPPLLYGLIVFRDSEEVKAKKDMKRKSNKEKVHSSELATFYDFHNFYVSVFISIN